MYTDCYPYVMKFTLKALFLTANNLKGKFPEFLYFPAQSHKIL